MEKLLDRLITVIGEEAGLFEHFLKALERQQTALIGNDTAELKRITSGLHEIVGRSKALEQERSLVVEEIRRQRGTEEDLDVARICEMADSTRSTHLQQLRETVLNLYQNIEETRMRNGLLIEQSLEQIKHTIETIGRIPAQKETYKKHGSISREYVPLGVDRRI